MTDQDAEFVYRLTQSTDAGKVDWKATATPDQYAAAFGGKWTVTVDKGIPEGGPEVFWLAINNADGEEMLRIYGVDGLFEKARRRALKVDEAIQDIFKELDKQ